MTDATRDGSMGIFAGEFLGIEARIYVWCSVGISFEGDGGNADIRSCGDLLFEVVVFLLAFGQIDSPAVIVYRDIDMVRVLERGRAAIERGIIEVPLRRGRLPDQFSK